MKNNFQRGQAMMIATVFFLVTSVTIIFGLVGPIAKEQRIATNSVLSRQSHFLSEAGVEDSVYRLITGKTVGTTEYLSLNGSTVSTSISNSSTGKDVVADASVNNLLRRVKVELETGLGISFHYGIQVGTSGFTLSNSAGVNGNVYSNGNISGYNQSFITGDAYAVGSVSGVDVGGTTQTGVSAESMPISDEQISDWKDQANSGGSVGSQNFWTGTNTLGPKKIQGSISVSGSAVLRLTGPIWITGTLNLSNNAIISVDPSLGSSSVVIIVDGTANLSNTSQMNGSGTSGSYILLLSLSSSSGAIHISNSAQGGIFYAPNGTISLSNSVHVKQITAKGVTLSNSATIDYEQGLVNASFTSGPSGGYEINSWEEIQ